IVSTARPRVRCPLFDPPQSTFQPTRKEANVPNINTIPGEDVFYMDSRVMPGIPLDDVVAWCRSRADEVAARHGVSIVIEPVQFEQAAPPTPADSPLVRSLQHAIREVHGREAVPMGIGGGTVAAYFRRHGLHAAVWSTVDESAHQANEYCRLPNLLADARVFARVLATL
ncbi:MAG TPA: M20/M25/M40 family metallo-hydrolase, partial [Candidatus Ozemobacteraceae bacterium]|nr:M20/M25/M40 family metallo-hydrolase [Candidatus Ozemobacteraceae bacterium]